VTIRPGRPEEAEAVLALWQAAMAPPSVTDSAEIVRGGSAS